MRSGIRRPGLRIVLTAAVVALSAAPLAGQGGVPRTPGGDPDLQGTYTNTYENGTPLERPAQFEGRKLEDVTGEELRALKRQIQQREEGDMRLRRITGVVVSAVAVVAYAVAPLGQTTGRYAPPLTPWGDPDLQGAYTNSSESQTPMERPESLAGRTLAEITPEELARLNEQRNQQRIEADRQRWELRSPLHWFENHDFSNSRAWLVIDPPDGKIPPQTAEARQRAAARAEARQGRGAADSWEDRSLYDRCITRGIPGSMMPAIYGNSYEIVQSPGFIAIMYEMVNETRVIPLDRRPHAASAIRMYMGDARGWFDGDTLVVETTNFTDKTPYRGSSQELRLVERFTPVAPAVVEWSVTFDDRATWERPWTFAMHLTRTSERPFEYACHEGNYAMRNMLSIARAEEAAASGGR